MPTAGRLAGAIIFMVFGWYLATLAAQFFPNERPPGYWFPMMATVSCAVGWKFCGARVGKGYTAAIGLGITTSLCIAFWAIFFVALQRMISNSMDLDYRGVMDAILNTFVLMYEFAETLYNVPLIITALIGGVICAWMTEFIGRRMP
jgi:hypothetical protein